jgi:DNA repair photolyase
MQLVGIARLASESELLEAKRQVEYFEIPTRSLLNRTKPGMPFRWTINPYRGCEFGCKYCYARPRGSPKTGHRGSLQNWP